MITPVNIKSAVIKKLKDKYKDIRCYGTDVKEGLIMPSFFIELVPTNISSQTVNTIQNDFLLYITYMTEKKSEVDALNKAYEIQNLFWMKLKVLDRYINVTEYSFDFIGEDSDTLQILVSLSYVDTFGKEEKQPFMNNVNFNTEMEE